MYPVERSHSISANVLTEERLDLMIRKAIAGAKRLQARNPESISYPMPIDTSDQIPSAGDPVRMALTSGAQEHCS